MKQSNYIKARILEGRFNTRRSERKFENNFTAGDDNVFKRSNLRRTQHSRFG